MKIKSLSIFFPAYNDAKSIEELINKANMVAQKITKDYEIIVINDGSKDHTKNILEKLQKTYKKLKVIHHSENLGYGAALSAGFKNSNKEWIFYTDGDGQYDPKDLSLLIKNINPNTDVVNGYKLRRADNFIRKILGYLYNSFLHLLYPIPIKDVDCDFRLIRRSKIKDIKLNNSGGSVCLELILKLQENRARFIEVGVHHYERMHGHSEFFNVKNVFNLVIQTCVLYVRYRILRKI
ncbi:MAG: glycosyltransferase family 2 protein [Patescibacteria group bacterium]